MKMNRSKFEQRQKPNLYKRTLIGWCPLFLSLAASLFAIKPEIAMASPSVGLVSQSAARVAQICQDGTRLPMPSFQTSASVSGATLSVRLIGVYCATEYHYRITQPDGTRVHGATRTHSISHKVSGQPGRYCVAVLAVGSGRRDSYRHNAYGTDPKGCTEVAAPPSTCVSNVQLGTPVFKTTSSRRAKFTGNTFSASWSNIACAGEYHFRLVGPNFEQFGVSRNGTVTVNVPESFGNGKFCLSVVAVNGGARPDSRRVNSNNTNQYGCATRQTIRLARLPAPVVSVTGTSTLYFDWADVAGSSEYHWAATYPDGHVERGTSSRYSSRQTIPVNGKYGGPICLEVRAVATGRDSALSNKSCKTVNDPLCAISDESNPITLRQQALRGYDLDLYSSERLATDFAGNNNRSNHIVVQSIFDPVVRNKDTIVDEYSLVAQVGWNLDTLAERQAFMTRLAKDMDDVLGGGFQSQGDFKLQADQPVVGAIIDIDAKGPIFDVAFVNAPVMITHIESQCFGVRTIEYNSDEHILHGDRRWGFEVLDTEGKHVKFYTRGISIPDRFYLPSQMGEKAFWSAWVERMQVYIEGGGGVIYGGTQTIDQKKSYNTAYVFDNYLASQERRTIRDQQVLSHSREVHRLNLEIRDAEQISNGRERTRVLNSLKNERREHQDEIDDWREIGIN